MVDILNLIDDARCFQTVRAMRWPAGVRCPECNSDELTKDGGDDSRPERQRYKCYSCNQWFDDLSGTSSAGHHQPLRVWILSL